MRQVFAQLFDRRFRCRFLAISADDAAASLSLFRLAQILLGSDRAAGYAWGAFLPSPSLPADLRDP